MTNAKEDVIYRSAASQLVSGRPHDAIDSLIQALKQNPDAGRLWELRGQAHLADGDAIDAVSCLEHASCLVPLTKEGQLALAHAYELTDKRDLAGDLFMALAGQDDLPAEMLEPLARGLGRVGKPDQALGVCAEAASRNPTSPAPLLGMVFYQRRLGHGPDRILPLLFRAFHLEPEDFDIRLALARMLHECGQKQEAAELLSVVEIETSRCPSCLVVMQEIFEDVGDQRNVGRCVNALVAIATQEHH